jgi:hypothetical protein
MEPWYVAMFKKLPLNRQTVSALLPVVGKYGAKGAVVMARSYLGPVACDVERRVRSGKDPCGHDVVEEKTENFKEEVRDTDVASETANVAGAAPKTATANATATKPSTQLNEVDVAILGMAVTKLIYEAGELALHNPTASSDGKHPEFKLDENGHAPALSLSHVVAATRLYRAYSAERAEKKEAEQAKVLAQEEADARARSAPRLKLQAARGQLYAGAPRYSYVNTSTRRG